MNKVLQVVWVKECPHQPVNYKINLENKKST